MLLSTNSLVTSTLVSGLAERCWDYFPELAVFPGLFNWLNSFWWPLILAGGGKERPVAW